MATGVPNNYTTGMSPSTPWETSRESEFDAYKRKNELREYLVTKMREEQDYAWRVQERADKKNREQLLYDDNRFKLNDDRQRMIRDRNGVPEPGFAGLWPNQPRNQLAMMAEDFRSNRGGPGGGMGEPGGGGEWQGSQYQNQPNPYQPRATELNNAPQNYLRKMVR